MKYFVSLFILFGLSLQCALAQDPFFRGGLNMGANFSQVDGDHLGGYNKVGVFGGFYLRHRINDKWQGQMEINYSQKGSNNPLDPEDPSPQIFTLAFHYLELPFLAIYEMDHVDLLFGYGIGNNISAKRDEGLGFVDADIKNWEHSLHFGGTYWFTERFAAGIRHSYSLFRVGDDYPNRLNVFNRIGLYNRLFTLHVGYALNPESR